MNFKNESFLILILVWSLPKYSNSYDLFKIMEWKFNLFDPTDILVELVNDKMLIRDDANKNFVYYITDIGKQNVIDCFKRRELDIYEKFSSEKDFLDILFDKLKLKSPPSCCEHE